MKRIALAIVIVFATVVAAEDRKFPTPHHQKLNPMAIRIRAATLEPNPIDNAASTTAAEAVNSTAPIKSRFITLLPSSQFSPTMRVYTSFISKNYLTRSDGRDGRDCKPNRLKTFSAPASARLQIGKAAATFFLPFEVSAI